jgi:hypothetical protein
MLLTNKRSKNPQTITENQRIRFQKMHNPL